MSNFSLRCLCKPLNRLCVCLGNSNSLIDKDKCVFELDYGGFKLGILIRYTL
jgi:hypothetical protein